MRKYRIKSFSVPAWMKSAVEVLRPVKRLKVSEWAEAKRIIKTGSMPGPWRNSVTPYLVEIMDAFSDETIERIVFVKPTQVGGTAAMENMLGCLADQDPDSTMVVYPSDSLAESVSEDRVIPMFKDCKDLAAKFREHDSKKLALKFRDMTIYLTGANSPADLSSRPIRYLFLDEVDKYPGASKRESDPISLAIERTKSYELNKKIYITSTPTLKTGHIWKAKEEADAEKHYFVPCPHCGAFIELKFAQIRWPGKDEYPDPSERAERAVYVCQGCGCIITDKDKGKMLEQGRWQIVRQKTERPRSVAFWISTLYSPFTRFTDIAREFMRSKDDPDLLHNFSNSWLAEPWEDTKLKTNAELVLERQTDVLAYTVPEWAEILTGAVDVQENCVYWVIRAWGQHLTSQNIAHGKALSLSEVERIMNLEYSKADGEKLIVNLTLIDSGDQTDIVYDFCANNSDWALPSKGVPERNSHFTLSTVNKTESRAYGMTLVLVDVGKYKDMIAARMRKANGTGAWMVHADCDMEYAEQVTAEHKITERNGAKTKLIWMKKQSHADNHYLDCEVYAAAAADVLNVRFLHLQSQGDLGREAPKRAEPAPQAPEETWIRDNDGWL